MASFDEPYMEEPAAKPFYRHREEKGAAADAGRLEFILPPTLKFVADRGGAALANIYLTEDLLRLETCVDIIDAAESAAQTQGGWSTKRHRKFPTTDVDCAVDPQLLSLCNGEVSSGLTV